MGAKQGKLTDADAERISAGTHFTPSEVAKEFEPLFN